MFRIEVFCHGCNSLRGFEWYVRMIWFNSLDMEKVRTNAVQCKRRIEVCPSYYNNPIIVQAILGLCAQGQDQMVCTGLSISAVCKKPRMQTIQGLVVQISDTNNLRVVCTNLGCGQSKDYLHHLSVSQELFVINFGSYLYATPGIKFWTCKVAYL